MKKRASLEKKIFRLVVITIVGLYFATQMWPLFSDASKKTFVVQYGKIEEVLPITAYIIRDERVISNIRDYAELELLVLEGDLVAKGQEIARFYLSDENDSNVEQELKLIEARIESILKKQTEGNVFQGDINRLEGQIQSNINQIQAYINSGDYERIYGLRKDLTALLEKRSIISGNYSFGGLNLKELEDKRAQLRKKLSSYIKIVHSNIPGYVALGSDGIGEIFNTENIGNIDFDGFKLIEGLVSNPKTEENGTAIRIINNFRYCIVTQIDSNKLSGLREGRRVRLRDGKSNREYRATVRRVISDNKGEDGKSLIVLDINEHMQDIFTNRILKIDLLKNVHEGIMIPNRSIIEIDGQAGVYKVDINGFVQFVPIQIRGQNKDYSIVHNSFFETLIDGETKRVLTINSFDEIVINVEGLKDGQKIRN